MSKFGNSVVASDIVLQSKIRTWIEGIVKTIDLGDAPGLKAVVLDMQRIQAMTGSHSAFHKDANIANINLEPSGHDDVMQGHKLCDDALIDAFWNSLQDEQLFALVDLIEGAGLTVDIPNS